MGTTALASLISEYVRLLGLAAPCEAMPLDRLWFWLWLRLGIVRSSAEDAHERACALQYDGLLGLLGLHGRDALIGKFPQRLALDRRLFAPRACGPGVFFGRWGTAPGLQSVKLARGPTGRRALGARWYLNGVVGAHRFADAQMPSLPSNFRPGPRVLARISRRVG